MFKIDGQSFNVGVVDIKREAQFLDKYANRTESGDLQRELIGVYYNYTLSFPALNLDMNAYNALYDKATEPVEFHTIEVPATIGTFTFTAYITGVTDNLFRIQNGKNHWGDLTMKFIAKAPSRK